jgi:hypothetical protein
MKSRLAVLICCVALSAIGCPSNQPTGSKPSPEEQPAKKLSPEEKINAAMEKLPPEDRAIAKAQKLCPIQDEPLGSMGVPIKVMVKDQPVFVCCKGCKEEAISNADDTLKKVAELKAKK